MKANPPLHWPRPQNAYRGAMAVGAAAASERQDVMPTDALVLDYAPPRPRGRFIAPVVAFIWARSVRIARWCLRNRHHLSGVAAFALAGWVIAVAFNARIVLATSIDGGRSQAWAGLYLSKWALMLMPLLWVGARRSRWSVRLARTSFVIAAIWWLYIQYMVHGGRGSWYW